jgi:hypothetical protein
MKKKTLGFTGLVLFTALSLLAMFEYLKKAGIEDIFDFDEDEE